MATTERKREYMQEWRRANRARLREYNREWLAKNKADNAPKAAVRNARYYLSRADEVLARKRARYAAMTPEQRLQYCGYFDTDPAVRAARKKDYQQRHPSRVAALVALRRARILRATPEWADLDAIRAVYEQAKALEAADGISRHVDHVIPLRGRLVSGLHVAENLQVLTADANMRKNNRYAA